VEAARTTFAAIQDPGFREDAPTRANRGQEIWRWHGENAYLVDQTLNCPESFPARLSTDQNVDSAVAQAMDSPPVKSKLAQAVGAIEVIAEVMLTKRCGRTFRMKHFNRRVQGLSAHRSLVIVRLS
jgi:hypothetical protein